MRCIALSAQRSSISGGPDPGRRSDTAGRTGCTAQSARCKPRTCQVGDLVWVRGSDAARADRSCGRRVGQRRDRLPAGDRPRGLGRRAAPAALLQAQAPLSFQLSAGRANGSCGAFERSSSAAAGFPIVRGLSCASVRPRIQAKSPFSNSSNGVAYAPWAARQGAASQEVPG